MFKKKWWIEPGFTASQTSVFDGNAKYTAKMTTYLHGGITVQIKARTSKTEIHQ